MTKNPIIKLALTILIIFKILKKKIRQMKSKISKENLSKRKERKNLPKKH